MHRGHIDRMLQRGVFSVFVDDPEKMPVQVHRVMHHCQIVEIRQDYRASEYEVGNQDTGTQKGVQNQLSVPKSW